MTRDRQRIAAQLETALAALTGLLAVVTIFWHDWIEAVTGTDPDHHNGSLEWLFVVGLAVVSACASTLARRTWRAMHTRPET